MSGLHGMLEQRPWLELAKQNITNMNSRMLSQRDLHWVNHRIGLSGLTIGNDGCALTCISMVSDQFGSFQDPSQIAGNTSWFTDSGLIIWKNIEIQNVKFNWRWYIENDNQILLYLSDIENKAVILNVLSGKHWIKAMKQVKTRTGTDYLCADPWTGKTCFAKATYGNIVGSAQFLKT